MPAPTVHTVDPMNIRTKEQVFVIISPWLISMTVPICQLWFLPRMTKSVAMATAVVPPAFPTRPRAPICFVPFQIAAKLKCNILASSDLYTYCTNQLPRSESAVVTVMVTADGTAEKVREAAPTPTTEHHLPVPSAACQFSWILTIIYNCHSFTPISFDRCTE